MEDLIRRIERASALLYTEFDPEIRWGESIGETGPKGGYATNVDHLSDEDKMAIISALRHSHG